MGILFCLVMLLMKLFCQQRFHTCDSLAKFFYYFRQVIKGQFVFLHI